MSFTSDPDHVTMPSCQGNWENRDQSLVASVMGMDKSITIPVGRQPGVSARVDGR